MYVRGVAEGGPVWKANSVHNKSNDGREGCIMLGDCLLDVQVWNSTSPHLVAASRLA